MWFCASLENKGSFLFSTKKIIFTTTQIEVLKRWKICVMVLAYINNRIKKSETFVGDLVPF